MTEESITSVLQKVLDNLHYKKTSIYQQNLKLIIGRNFRHKVIGRIFLQKILKSASKGFRKHKKIKNKNYVYIGGIFRH
jgi:hypothetical protein